jgi:hypothetical protein
VSPLPAAVLGSRSTPYHAGLIGAGIAASPHLRERESAALGRSGRYELLDISMLGVDPGDVGPRCGCRRW